MTETRRRKKQKTRINNILLLIILVLMILTIPAFLLNMSRVRNVDTGQGETIEEEVVTEVDNELLNDYYSIGYNATSINKDYFRELDRLVEDALEADNASSESTEAGPVRDNAKIAESVVKCFITEYYTWTNKDGNYDIGGMQYIFTDKRKDFEKYTRYNFYADMDKYLTQYDRDTLIQVKDVTVNSVEQTDDFTPEGSESVYECWLVDASWTYEESSSMDTSEIQSDGEFLVVNHDGRLEIAAINQEEVSTDEQTEYGYGY